MTSAGGVSYGYDNNGNLTSRGSDSFSWDAEDRLTSATVTSVTTTFAYNGDGLRDSRTQGSTTTFTSDVNLSIPQVLDDGTFKYVYGIGRIAEVGPGTTTHHYLPDGLGSTMALVSSNGSVVNTYDYDVFGAIRVSTGSQANEFKFTGEQVDSGTGLHYLRARYYDPAVGRFFNRDRWAGHVLMPSSLNRYVYVLNNPLNLTDPLGRSGSRASTWLWCLEMSYRCGARGGTGGGGRGPTARVGVTVGAGIGIGIGIVLNADTPSDNGADGGSTAGEYEAIETDYGTFWLPGHARKNMELAGLTPDDIADAIETAVDNGRTKPYKDRASGDVYEGYMDDDAEVFVGVDHLIQITLIIFLPHNGNRNDGTF